MTAAHAPGAGTANGTDRELPTARATGAHFRHPARCAIQKKKKP